MHVVVSLKKCYVGAHDESVFGSEEQVQSHIHIYDYVVKWAPELYKIRHTLEPLL